MSPGLAAELERIRRLADPPPARHCAWSGCGKPLVRRPGEEAGDYAKRQCCDAECGRKQCAELSGSRTCRFGSKRA